MIPFNKPYQTGEEIIFIKDVLERKRISGNGYYTEKCHNFFSEKMGFKNTLLTNSCTHALEMIAILLDIKNGDEIIMPSFTYVSTANAFALRGAKIIFIDSSPNNPNMDVTIIEEKLSSKTKAIVVVHYAGIACDMSPIMSLAKRYNIKVIEDAAHAISSYYKSDENLKPQLLGSIGHFATFSFHETKNISCGEGGLLIVNDDDYWERSQIIWQKGTNKHNFLKKQVNSYEWVDLGSSFSPSELNAAYLYAQLLAMEHIQKKRIQLWLYYEQSLKKLKLDNFKTPNIPDYSTINGSIFFIVLEEKEIRNNLLSFLNQKNIHAVFHYQVLHRSSFFLKSNSMSTLPNSDKFTNQILRLPLFYELENGDINIVIEHIHDFLKKNK